MDEFFHSSEENTVFSTLNISFDYWRANIEERDRNKTAITSSLWPV